MARRPVLSCKCNSSKLSFFLIHHKCNEGLLPVSNGSRQHTDIKVWGKTSTNTFHVVKQVLKYHHLYGKATSIELQMQ
jgi:hypothetical protein